MAANPSLLSSFRSSPSDSIQFTIDMSTTGAKLFSSIKYFTTGFRDASIETDFKQHGATRLFYLTEKTTHVICDDFESNKDELEQAIEIYQTPIVTSNWIVGCLKSNTLLPTDAYRSAQEETTDAQDNKRLFQSCTFANANLINNDHNKIYALATYYGGRWIANLDSFICTHIICASALTGNASTGDANNNHQDQDERLQDAYEIQSDKVHLVSPDWILDCVNANTLLKEADYHPDLLGKSNESMIIDDSDEDRSTTLTSSTRVSAAGSCHPHTLILACHCCRNPLIFNLSSRSDP